MRDLQALVLGRRRWLQCTVLGSWGLLTQGSAHAQSTNANNAIILTVQSASGGQVDFDMNKLVALPQRTIKTLTPWYEGPRSFTGPLLRDVLQAAGAKGKTLRAVALNDYKVDIPFQDALDHDVVMARLLDGQAMSVRQKGPLFIIYPFDDKASLRTPEYFSRCAWQLRRLDVLT